MIEHNKQRPFLKWAGGKFRLVDTILQHLPKEGRTQLVEPFVGAGSLFLNSGFKRYLLADINPDLINLYCYLKKDPNTLIKKAMALFTPENNDATYYYSIREAFNNTEDQLLRSIYFIYMNKHGYNGLCRYNKKGRFNVPIGKYKKVEFPEAQLLNFAKKAKEAVFLCADYQQAFKQADDDAVIYCDPPYVPLNIKKKSNGNIGFTSYATEDFSIDQQRELAQLARETAQKRKIPVLISNHDTDFTREIYKEAQLTQLQVKRHISRNGQGRANASELLALFLPNH